MNDDLTNFNYEDMNEAELTSLDAFKPIKSTKRPTKNLQHARPGREGRRTQLDISKAQTTRKSTKPNREMDRALIEKRGDFSKIDPSTIMDPNNVTFLILPKYVQKLFERSGYYARFILDRDEEYSELPNYIMAGWRIVMLDEIPEWSAAALPGITRGKDVNLASTPCRSKDQVLVKVEIEVYDILYRNREKVREKDYAPVAQALNNGHNLEINHLNVIGADHTGILTKTGRQPLHRLSLKAPSED